MFKMQVPGPHSASNSDLCRNLHVESVPRNSDANVLVNSRARTGLQGGWKSRQGPAISGLESGSCYSVQRAVEATELLNRSDSSLERLLWLCYYEG